MTPKIWLLCGVAATVCACVVDPKPPVDPRDPQVVLGEQIFFNETFDGNGRTCGTCHRAEDNFAASPAFIAALPPDDALFVAETLPALGKNFENPVLMRELSLILENQDGFEDLENDFNMRGIPHTLGLRHSIASRQGPRTGWSGDGAPGDGSLRAFAIGAIIQHFTKTTARVLDEDFRFPTDEEMDALEAFQLSLGRQQELSLPLPLKGSVAARGQEIFNDLASGKCAACHVNAGANANPALFNDPDIGNQNFASGVEDLPDQPADLLGQKNPPDDGFGIPGNGEFNTPSLVEAADTGPFFHNNAIETIEGAVAFYNGDAFNNSAAGQLVRQASGSGINLDATQVVAVAAFLRVINALENIRESVSLLGRARILPGRPDSNPPGALSLAGFETHDAIEVLVGGGLHPRAVARLREASGHIDTALAAVAAKSSPANAIDLALAAHDAARAELVD